MTNGILIFIIILIKYLKLELLSQCYLGMPPHEYSLIGKSNMLIFNKIASS